MSNFDGRIKIPPSPVGNGLNPFLHRKVVIEGLGDILHLFLILQMWIKSLRQFVTRIVLRLGIGAQGLNPQWLQSPLIIFSLLFRNWKYCSDWNWERKLTILVMNQVIKRMRTGIKLQDEWGEIVALEGSKSPWEAQRATKTSPSVFATFEKASTCAKRTFCWEKSSDK